MSGPARQSEVEVNLAFVGSWSDTSISVSTLSCCAPHINAQLYIDSWQAYGSKGGGEDTKPSQVVDRFPQRT